MNKLILLSLVLMSCVQPEVIQQEKVVSSASVSVVQSVAQVKTANPQQLQQSNVQWAVYFSPKGGCQSHVVDLILSAKTSIRMLAYSFTSQEISDALILAGKKGVDVQIVLDKSDTTGKGTKVDEVYNSGVVKVYIDHKHAIAHNKVLVIDSGEVETGSFNYTEAAQQNNAENCIFLKSNDITKEYLENWELHKSHSVLYVK